MDRHGGAGEGMCQGNLPGVQQHEWMHRDACPEMGDPGGVRVRMRFLRQPRGDMEGADERLSLKGDTACIAGWLFRDKSRDVTPLSLQHPLLHFLLPSPLAISL